MRGRAYRRHQRERAKNHARKIWKRGLYKEEWLEDAINKSYKNMTYCSAPCCGNLRRHFGLKTIQEQRQEGKADRKGYDYDVEYNFHKYQWW